VKGTKIKKTFILWQWGSKTDKLKLFVAVKTGVWNTTIIQREQSLSDENKQLSH
jgi:hypothetical protein